MSLICGVDVCILNFQGNFPINKLSVYLKLNQLIFGFNCILASESCIARLHLACRTRILKAYLIRIYIMLYIIHDNMNILNDSFILDNISVHGEYNSKHTQIVSESQVNGKSTTLHEMTESPLI